MQTKGNGSPASPNLQFWSLLTYRALVVALLSATSFFSFKVYQTVAQKGVPMDKITFKLNGISSDVSELTEDVGKLSSDIEDQKTLVDQAADSANEAAEACNDLRFR